jgi:hypothetical protein
MSDLEIQKSLVQALAAGCIGNRIIIGEFCFNFDEVMKQADLENMQ